jgi:hypothetical protein
MDPKGKGMVINDKEKETINIDDPKGDKPTDSGSNNKRKGRRKGASRRSSTTTATPPLLHQGTMRTKTHPRKRKQLIKIIPLIILAFLTIQTLIYCLFHLENPLALMEKIIHFGVIKCVVIMVEPPELFQIKCPSHALEAATHINQNNPRVPQI